MKIVVKEKDMCERTKGTMIATTSEDNVNCKITRNVSTFKRIPKPKEESQDQSIHDFDDVHDQPKTWNDSREISHSEQKESGIL
jgi:hypothetical protein